MTSNDIVRLLALGIVVCMGLTVAIYVWSGRRRARILEGPLAIATVTSFQQRLAGKGVPVNETGLRFSTATRQTVNVHLIAPRRSRTYRVGEQVQLRHEPARPERFLIVGDDHAQKRVRLVVTIALATDAVLLLLIGLYQAGVIDPR
ncbi:MAG: DUF3592 domain-containing protein [Burkholderiales bacterium]|nr:DUF3592 domain-containing protein [Burkholderiales bacterium]